MKKRWSVALTILFLACAVVPTDILAFENTMAASKETIVPLSKAHAHNDYEHDRPLFDALDHGFTSVEADVWLVDDKLLVAHDREDVQPNRTLESLYLKPLKQRIKSNNGSVYSGYKLDFLLWVDIKSDGDATYRVLHKELQRYQNMLTRFLPSGVKPGAVTVIVSGNRPRDLMKSQVVRYATYDGRMSDLESNESNEFMPVISDNWRNHFSWMGDGIMPETERTMLNEIISTAHENNRMVRFWNTPDDRSPEREAIWKELLMAGVDLINTDDLEGLEQFLKEHDPKPSKPHIIW